MPPLSPPRAPGRGARNMPDRCLCMWEIRWGEPRHSAQLGADVGAVGRSRVLWHCHGVKGRWRGGEPSWETPPGLALLGWCPQHRHEGSEGKGTFGASISRLPPSGAALDGPSIVPSFPIRPLLLVGSLSALLESVEVGRISDLRDRLLDFKPTAPVAVAVGMPQCKFRFRNGEPGAIQCRITIAQSRACTDFLIAVGALSSSSQFLNFFVFLCLRGLWLCDCGWQTCRLQGRREPATLQVGKMASQNPLGINADIDVDYSAF